MNRRSKSISLGDKIFARVTKNGQTVFNYVTEKVATISQLLSEIRLAIKDIQGLVMIHIRNYHKGWGEERPLMLYSEKVRNYTVYSNEAGEQSKGEHSRTMLFPWETH